MYDPCTMAYTFHMAGLERNQALLKMKSVKACQARVTFALTDKP